MLGMMPYLLELAVRYLLACRPRASFVVAVAHGGEKSLHSSMSFTALVVVLVEPQGATAQRRLSMLQHVRKVFDPAYRRWPPHITLVPPAVYTPDGQDDALDPPAWLVRHLQRLTAGVERVCAEHPTHILQLRHLAAFERREAILHLRPSASSAEPLLSLQADVAQAALPHMPGVRLRSTYVPHMTLGRVKTVERRRELEQRVMEVLGDGLEVRVDRVHIMYKRGEAKQPYTTWRALPLGIRVP